MPQIHITLTPKEIENLNFKKATLVMIDTLRASTTIITAFNYGVTEIKPFKTKRELEQFYLHNQDQDYLLAGEKEGKPFSGFLLGNSPYDFMSTKVRKKKILMKTSNGTYVLNLLPSNTQVLIASLVNCQALINKIIQLGQDVYFICAGSNASFSLEDFFTAGCFSYLLKKKGWSGNDLVVAAARIFEANKSYEKIVNLFSQSSNGQNLIEIGYKRDLEFAAQMDVYNLVPIWDGKIIII